jgi:PEP-CTERM motif
VLRSVPLASASALITLLVFCAPAASASEVIQSQSFDLAGAFVVQPATPGLFSTGDTEHGSETFAAFDTTLGALTGVQLAVAATLHGTMGISVVATPGSAPGGIFVDSPDYGATVEQGFTVLDELGGHISGMLCTTANGPCAMQFSYHQDENLDYAFSDLSPYLLGSPLTFAFDFNSGMSGLTDGATPVPLYTAAGDMDWAGVATLTYTYDPAVAGATVPEPSTWALLLVGFGFAGGALRRSRRVAIGA